MSTKKMSLLLQGIGVFGLFAFIFSFIAPEAYSNFNEFLGGPAIRFDNRHYIATTFVGVLSLASLLVGLRIKKEVS